MADNDERIQEERKLAVERVQKECIAMVMRQTDYDEETANEMLHVHKGDYGAVIRTYLTGTPVLPKEDIDKGTVNQRMFKEIRTYMDTASSEYYRKKEMMEKRQLLADQANKDESTPDDS